MMMQDRMANLEKLRLEVDSRRRTVDGLNGMEMSLYILMHPEIMTVRLALCVSGPCTA